MCSDDERGDDFYKNNMPFAFSLSFARIPYHRQLFLNRLHFRSNFDRVEYNITENAI